MRFSTYCRSMLVTPALSVERFARGQQSGADMCVVDLEDSVAPAFKDAARSKAEAIFSAPRTSPSRRVIRINSITRHEGLRDLLAIRSYATRPDVVLVPKVESPRDLEIVAQALGSDCAHVELMALVETARGVENANAIATATPRLKALVFGAADFSFNIGASLSWEPMQYARARLVSAARAANLHVVDSPFFDITNLDGLRQEALLARTLGFSGKAAIHPSHIESINRAFSPDERTLQNARKLIAESQAKDFNVVVVDGTMMGTPFVEAARQMLEEFGPREG